MAGALPEVRADVRCGGVGDGVHREGLDRRPEADVVPAMPMVAVDVRGEEAAGFAGVSRTEVRCGDA